MNDQDCLMSDSHNRTDIKWGIFPHTPDISKQEEEGKNENLCMNSILRSPVSACLV